MNLSEVLEALRDPIQVHLWRNHWFAIIEVTVYVLTGYALVSAARADRADRATRQRTYQQSKRWWGLLRRPPRTGAGTFHDSGGDWPRVSMMLGAMGFTLVLERIFSHDVRDLYLALERSERTAYQYQVDDFVLGVVGVPLWVPVGWGLIFYLVMVTSDRLITVDDKRHAWVRWAHGVLARAACDATLALTIDFVLDPVAEAVGWWVWTPRVSATLLFNVPASNYFAWYIIIFALSLMARTIRMFGMRERQIWPAEGKAAYRVLHLFVAALLPAYAALTILRFLVRKVYELDIDVGQPDVSWWPPSAAAILATTLLISGVVVVAGGAGHKQVKYDRSIVLPVIFLHLTILIVQLGIVLFPRSSVLAYAYPRATIVDTSAECAPQCRSEDWMVASATLTAVIAKKEPASELRGNDKEKRKIQEDAAARATTTTTFVWRDARDLLASIASICGVPQPEAGPVTTVTFPPQVWDSTGGLVERRCTGDADSVHVLFGPEQRELLASKPELALWAPVMSIVSIALFMLPYAGDVRTRAVNRGSRVPSWIRGWTWILVLGESSGGQQQQQPAKASPPPTLVLHAWLVPILAHAKPRLRRRQQRSAYDGVLKDGATALIGDPANEDASARRLTWRFPARPVGAPGDDMRPRTAPVAATALQMGLRDVAARHGVQLVIVIDVDGGPTVRQSGGAAGGQIVCTLKAKSLMQNTALHAGAPAIGKRGWLEGLGLKRGPATWWDLQAWHPHRVLPGLWELEYDDAMGSLDAPFQRMFATEIAGWVEPRRQGSGRPAPAERYRPSVTNDLYGVAFSGGGMRAATFSLGAAQALAEHDLLNRADYIASVSGGGFFATALAGLTAEELPYRDAPALGYTPATFPFARRWQPAQPPLEPAAAATRPVSPVHGNESPALWYVRKNARFLGRSVGLFDYATWIAAGRYTVSVVALFVLLLLLPLLATTAVAEHLWITAITETQHAGCKPNRCVEDRLPSNVRWFLAGCGGFVGSASPTPKQCETLTGAPANSTVKLKLEEKRALIASAGLVLSVALIAMVLAAVVAWRRPATRASERHGLPKIVMQRVVIPLTYAAGAFALIWAIGVTAYVVRHANELLPEWASWRAGAGAAATIAVATTLFTLVKPEQWARIGGRLLLGFGGALLLAIAAVAATLASQLIVAWYANAPGRLGGTTVPTEAWLALVATIGFVAPVVISLLIGTRGYRWMNAFSLGPVYAAWIQRTWGLSALSASTRALEASARRGLIGSWTEVWTDRPPTLDTLRAHALAVRPPRAPYTLICAAANFPANLGEKMPERKSDSFVISALFSGSALTRWRPTRELRDVRRMSLPEAAAISAAAFASTMGERSSLTLSVGATVFNARLGRWLANPRTIRKSRQFYKRWIIYLYLCELLGWSSRDNPYIYVTDGGHFDNSGVYELLRRRCRYIVAILADSEPVDGEDAFGNIATALRMARVDFGVEVELPNLASITRDRTGQVQRLVTAGTIRYPGEGDTGTLVLIKSGIPASGVPVDLLAYRQSNRAFPYDSTTDQRFEQPQFESYRRLGYLAATQFADRVRGQPFESWSGALQP